MGFWIGLYLIIAASAYAAGKVIQSRSEDERWNKTIELVEDIILQEDIEHKRAERLAHVILTRETEVQTQKRRADRIEAHNEVLERQRARIDTRSSQEHVATHA